MIRTYQPDDLSPCVALLKAVYNNNAWQCRWSDETGGKYLQDYVKSGDFIGFVTEEGGVVFGAAFAHRKTWWNNDELFIDEIFIHPEKQRQGYGKILLAHMEAYCREKGLAGITLLTNRHMPARDFYEALGYQEAGHVVYFYKVV